MTNGVARVVASLSASDALDRDKPIPLASFTKLWVAVAVLRMVERGELSLDDSIATTLPELPARRWAASTVRELLTHTSLVPDFPDGFFTRTDVDWSSPVTVLAQRIPTWSEHRGVYKYRNAEFALLGAILARRAGLPADRVLAHEVFEPSAMTHSGLLGAAPPNLDLRPMGSIRAQNGYTAGAGYASANDLLSFFEALAGDKLLKPASKELLFTGFGCWGSRFDSTLLIERTGSLGNVRIFAAFFPEEHRALVAWNASAVDLNRGKKIPLDLTRLALDERAAGP
jgi:CubicO group peptidase (beta-lactamase class C family)